MANSSYTLAEIADILQGEVHGDPHCRITGVSTLQTAKKGDITFLDNIRYRQYLADTQASAVLMSAAHIADCQTNAIILDNPYLGYAKTASLFENLPKVCMGIHPTAVIGLHCQIDPSASIGPLCVIGDHTIIGPNAVIGEGSSIGERCVIGASTYLWPRVTLYYAVQIGERVIIHSGAVIGSDGFGFAHNKGQWHKVPQLGTVIIGNDVEIGANTTIDRGALNNTTIANGVKIDNQVQIAHNVSIGAHTAIAGCVGIAGSTSIGQYCQIGGGTGIAGHIKITDWVMLAGGSLVAQSITEPGAYASGIPAHPLINWKKNMVRVHQLDELARRLRNLEKRIDHSLTLKEEESL
jgi:UDP-3-O-[3-hydroxymyristoyl] glucosamine N-acyltransferase